MARKSARASTIGTRKATASSPASAKASKGQRVKLQVALDLVNLHRALEIGREAVAGGADWVEAGTPLIKSEGLDAVRSLRKEFPSNDIVADMKIMDTGGLETEMAIKAGASVVGVLGVSDDGTIMEAVEAARKYGGKVIVDLIGVKDTPKRAAEAERLGAHLVALHIGVDEQMKGGSPIEMVRDVVKATSLPVAVAGGLTSETVAPLVEAGASVIIVGGAITKAKDATAATRAIRKAIDEVKSVPSAGMKKFSSAEIREALMIASSPNVSDAMHREGAMDGINAVLIGAKAVGPALTVSTMDGDWAKPVEAIDQAEPGTIIVVKVHGDKRAVWGELASHTSKAKGLAGVVIDGSIRDVDEIRRIAFPAWARLIRPNAGDPKGFGEIGVEIEAGGQRVRTDDWIVADENGVVVLPRERAQEIANRAVDVKEQEDRLREEIARGSTLSKVLKLKKWEKTVG
ncbi:MAG: orotidine 5'-phosphate decarboxylase [Euryarchaeota archaeon]|nr:orotidine 5'-phosphate decarboxylase [Euryarchaeota archaeon]